MHANRPAESDNDDVVVEIARGIEANQGGIAEKLRILVNLFTHKNALTDARLTELETETGRQDERLLDLGSRSASLESSTEDLKERSVNTELRLDNEEAKSLSLRAATEALLKKNNDLESSIIALESRADTDEARVGALEPRVGGLEAATEELDSRTAALVLRQDETALRTEVLEHQAGKLADADERHAIRTDGLEQRLKWASWTAGHLIFILSVIVAVSYWNSSTSQDTAAFAMNKNLSAVESELSANLDKQVASIYSTTSQEIDDKAAAIDAKLANVDARLSGQLSQGLTALESERAHLLALSQESQRKIAQLQRQFSESSTHSSELQSAHESLDQSLQGITKHLQLVEAQFKAELATINERIYAKDEGAGGASLDMSALNDESWLKAQNPNQYSIQLVGAYRKSDLARFIQRHSKALPLEELSYFKRVRNGRDWYVLLFGSYRAFQPALDKLESLPGPLQKNGPYIRRIKSVQESISRSSSS